MKLATAVAPHRRQTTQFSQFRSFLPVIPSPAFSLEAALLSLHSQQPHLLVSSFEPGPGDSCRVPRTLPATGHPPNGDCSSLSPGIRGILRVPRGFFCATSAEDIKALILKASPEPFPFLSHLSRAVASNRRIKGAGLSGLNYSPVVVSVRQEKKPKE